jgi:HIV Tat-specific factor 1
MEEDGEVRSEKAELGIGNPAYCSYVEGVYTYRDPGSLNEFSWDEAGSEWRPKKVFGAEVDYDGTAYSYKDADGTLFEWDPQKSAWFPKLDEEFLVRYQLSYGVRNSEEEDQQESASSSADSSANNRSSVPIMSTEEKERSGKGGVKRKQAPGPPSWFEVEQSQNTKVYVSNLPLDIREEEFLEFMQKCGLVMKDPVTGEIKMKLYTDGEGNKKGDGLCTYIKVESVNLALQILDGADLRGNTVSVERAQFELKGQYDPAKKPRSKKKKDKAKLKKMQDKLFEWEPEKLRGERAKHERIVVVQNAFAPEDFDKDVGLILEYQQDFREEAAKCGNCKKVVVFDVSY